MPLPRSRDASTAARRLLAAHFAGDMAPRALSDLQTVTSELVNNAVVHGEGQITLRAGRMPDCVRVEVVDEGEGNAPAIRERGVDEPGGWGLSIVENLSRRWGAFEGTTHVWADVPMG